MLVPMGPSDLEVLATLTRWAEADERVRALILTSSRANPASKVDALSDFDMAIGVHDSADFQGNPAWLEDAYGAILVRHDPKPGSTSVPGQFNRLVIHKDGTKIDWQVWPVESLRTALRAPALRGGFDVGYRFLFDKDGLSQGATSPTYTAHIPARPTSTDYLAVVEEFWWETSYVAKNLWRDELMPAKHSLE
ncbi:MAG: aminoglycoside 6-adenylyltransferase, partial [Dehalococcoidia bacterium]